MKKVKGKLLRGLSHSATLGLFLCKRYYDSLQCDFIVKRKNLEFLLKSYQCMPILQKKSMYAFKMCADTY